ncbi:MAG: hypothetical protein RBR67_17975, partial [Desulfobacterium sp.]|nr:hypothetical protein [Desulfobacterium sp.]
ELFLPGKVYGLETFNRMLILQNRLSEAQSSPGQSSMDQDSCEFPCQSLAIFPDHLIGQEQQFRWLK